MSLFRKENHTKAIVVGCGSYGSAIAAMLSSSDDSVFVIDSNAQAFSDLPSGFRGTCLQGNGEDAEILENAGIDSADILIAATGNDNTNIMIAQMAEKFYQVKNVYVRLNDISKGTVCGDTRIMALCPMKLFLNELQNRISDAKEGS